MSKQQVKIFDTTLRDGQQCPGAGMTLENNLEYARLAKRVGIDIVEAGFPSASQLDFKIVKLIAEEFADDTNSPIVAGLCQLREQQVDMTIEALAPAIAGNKAMLHVYLPVDPNLMQASLGSYADQKDKMLEDLYRLVKRAADAGLAVEFSPEGYSRMGDNFDFVTDTIRSVVSAGATIINCPDTIGGACRLEGEDYFVEKMKKHAAIIREEFPDKDITWSAHCHNDFGLALDNTMNAVFHGPATQIEGCFNGIGERAGNVSLEQCIMYIKHFGENNVTERSFYTKAKPDNLQVISDFVSEHMLPRQPHWPISGENAAKHSSGGHTNAIIKNPCAYQPFDPAEVGKDISFIFGPLSGGNHAKQIIETSGYQCDDKEKQAIAQHIKDFFQDRRKGVTDTELMTAYFDYRTPMKITQFNYVRKDNEIGLQLEGKFFDHPDRFDATYQGDDSALAALSKAIGEHLVGIAIETYKSESLEEGVASKSQSTIIVSYGGKHFTGVGEDHDIEVSALKALVDAANQAYIEKHYMINTESAAATA